MNRLLYATAQKIAGRSVLSWEDRVLPAPSAGEKITQLINTIQQCPWAARSPQTSQETTGLLRNPKVRYRVHNTPPQMPLLNQIIFHIN
jgi:hypothetical protein